MGSIPILLQYFLFNAVATVSGILYWMSIENMQPVEQKRKDHKKLVFVFILSLLISPVGVWIVSTIIRLNKITPAVRNSDH